MALTEDERKKLIAKAEKLMRFTKEKGCSEGEILNAASLLGKLLRDNNIALEDISVSSIKEDIIEDASTMEFGRMQDWERLLFSVIANTCFCFVVYHKEWAPTKKQPRRTKTIPKIAGSPADAKMCRYFCDVFCIILPSYAKEYCNGLKYNNRSERAEASESFLKGMIVKINERLKSMIRPPEDNEAESNRSLMVIHNKGEAVALYREEKYGDCKKAKSASMTVNMEHYENGLKKGEEVDIKFGVGKSEEDEKLEDEEDEKLIESV